MLKDISTIKIQGANFDTLTPLALFESRDGKDKDGNDQYKTIKGTLLYGRNGAGKSSIARVFRKAKGEILPAIKQVSFADKDDNIVFLTEDDKNRIFVFDEDFVNNKVKLKEDHLDTIVMLGQAADLADKIEIAEHECDVAKASYESKAAIYNEYQDTHNPKSPKRCLWKIGEALRGDDAWAGRDARLRDGARQNTQVRDDTYKKFLNLTPEKKKTELLIEFEEQMKILEAAKTGSSKIGLKVSSIPQNYERYGDEAIIELLERKIEKPKLSEREQYLLSLVEEGKAESLSQKAIYFKNVNVQICPYCLQSVSSDYKLSLIDSIEKVLSKTVEEHQREMEGHIYDVIIIDVEPFSVLSSYESCTSLIGKINDAIQVNNKLIRQKIEKPYQPITTSNSNIKKLIDELKEELTNLESERIEYNNKATDTRPILNKLNEINSYIAHYDIVGLVDEYEKQQAEFLKAEKDFIAAKEEYDVKKKAVEDLEAQRKNVQLALDMMNACLKYIFFAEDRLRIDYSDGEYRLYSHGKSVRPCDVSVGERNIIGLSYFFTSIMEGQEEKNAYGREYFLIIDDPVSSYDTENRIGILSFLKYKLSMFLEGNEFSRALVMTHDLMTFYDIYKVFDEIVDSCKKNRYSVPPKFNIFEMKDGTIIQFKYKNRQEYTEIIKLIYDYGQGNTNDNNLVIGNLMRQALEAFSTFQYKKGIEEVSTDKDILMLLPEVEYQSYYKNLMYRLVLHGSSHKEEQIKAMKDYDFFSLISDAEKKRTAKEVLCFIYLLDKHHILQHLKDVKNAEITLDTWCNEVKARAAMP